MLKKVRNWGYRTTLSDHQPMPNPKRLVSGTYLFALPSRRLSCPLAKRVPIVQDMQIFLTTAPQMRFTNV
jgi:hypothetical protein